MALQSRARTVLAEDLKSVPASTLVGTPGLHDGVTCVTEGELTELKLERAAELDIDAESQSQGHHGNFSERLQSVSQVHQSPERQHCGFNMVLAACVLFSFRIS